MRPDLPPAAGDPVLQQTAGAWPTSNGDWPDGHWWQSFGDTGLDAVIAQSLAANPDLATATAHAREAAAAARAAGSARLPTLDATGSLMREQLSANGLVPPPYGGMTLNAADLSASLAWRLDLFGAERARIEAQASTARAAALDVEYARTATAAATARLYFELAAALSDRDVVVATLEQRNAVLRVTRSRVNGGMDALASLREAEGQIPALELERAGADERIALARNALAALMGAGPDATAALTPAPSAPSPWAAPTDLRLALLAHRADVVAARTRVEAAAAGLTAARRDFLPNVNLVALAGLSSLDPGVLFSSASRTWSAGPAIELPIFDAGRRRATRDAREAALEAASASYRRAVIDAVREVTDALARLGTVAEQRRAAAAALAAERDAARLAQLRYTTGLGTLLEVLAVQDRVLRLERQAAMLENRERALRVDLYEALGGGWPPPGAHS